MCQEATRGISLLAFAGTQDLLLIAGLLVLLLAVVVLTALFGDKKRREAALEVLTRLVRWHG
jgi:hypothetical protein